MKNFREKADLIWNVADLLRGDYKQSDYGKVILPMTVLRRLDSVLAPTKKDVLKELPKLDSKSESGREILLNKKAKQSFHNKSEYDFTKLKAEPENIAQNLRNYINGFSTNAREIIEYFEFDKQIDRLDNPKTDLLYQIIVEFEKIDLAEMSTMEMGYVFEELIRKFAEQSNETAGEHFTPREVIRLMVNLIFNEDRDILTKKGIVKTLYDPACGTGGMLSEAETYLKELNPDAKLEVFGQELNPESYAICKSDMLIKGQTPDNIKYGNSFTDDGLHSEKFDYMLSNPPFGVNWKKAQSIIMKEYEKYGFAGRFGAGTPRINDGSLLFLQHMISKMKADGSRIGIVFNGSPLFSGSAGSGESEIRKWIIENDWLEAIVAMPDQLFYNTGISTYIWVITNKKDKSRKGKVQLINATGEKDEELIADGRLNENRFWEKMPKSLGNKRKKISENGNNKGIGFITQIYGKNIEGEFSKIMPNEYFGYWRVTVEQPQKKNGKIVKDGKGNPKADPKLRDYENIPFLRKDENGKLVKQSIDEYFKREVLPHLPEAWIDESKTKEGYELNFTKYFYEFKPLRDLHQIKQEILELEKSTIELEKNVLN
ncbi:MAG: SAM-dependent DNA methyltransferase [Ignavibacteria bacterium]|nr:SAM-dependent DNA methyltransferase [Ignavibacteria bacterium]